MRWIPQSEQLRGKEGSTRIVSKFLWVPKTLPPSNSKGPAETRWLERCQIQQVVKMGIIFPEDETGLAWEDFAWVD